MAADYSCSLKHPGGNYPPDLISYAVVLRFAQPPPARAAFRWSMTEPSSPPPLVLTLALDPVSFATFDALRKAHFPPERNWLPAHLTLFHALPGSEERRIVELLEAECQNRVPLQLLVSGVRLLGSGVAYEIQSLELEDLRMKLAQRWKEWLTPQDRQGFRPHVTIQNKVSPAAAHALYERLSREFGQREARGEGLLLWRYMGGPWALVRKFSFVAERDL